MSMGVPQATVASGGSPSQDRGPTGDGPPGLNTSSVSSLGSFGNLFGGGGDPAAVSKHHGMVAVGTHCGEVILLKLGGEI